MRLPRFEALHSSVSCDGWTWRFAIEYNKKTKNKKNGAAAVDNMMASIFSHSPLYICASIYTKTYELILQLIFYLQKVIYSSDYWRKIM